MKKILILTLCCFMYANVASGKVCFLADPDCKIGGGPASSGKSGGGGQNPTPDNEKMCKDEPGFYSWVKLSVSCEPYRIEACKDTTGNYFKGCDTDEGYYDIEMIKEDGVYEAVDENCGCAKIQCPSTYKICDNDEVGEGKRCVDEDGVEKYERCVCNRKIYTKSEQECSAYGEVQGGSCCSDTKGTWCTQCFMDECKDLGLLYYEYDEIPEDKKCSTEEKIELADGTYKTCYTDCYPRCPLETKEECEEQHPNSICVEAGREDCWEMNGCKDGFEEINGECTCKYTSEEACVDDNENFVCLPNEVGCYHPDGCEQGYSLVDGICVQDIQCEYDDEEACETANKHSDCTLVDGCYEPTACMTGFKPSVTECGKYNGRGYTLEDVDINGCGKCEPKICELTEDTCEKTNGLYSRAVETGEYSGNKPCLKCVCKLPAKCKWTASNKDNAELSNKCCNGKYEICTSNCVAVNVPENATVTETCTGCNVEVATAWECDPSYTKVGDECVAQSICNVGDIVYTDKTCTSPDKYDPNKNPVGIVFYVDASGKKGKIMSLDYMVNPLVTNTIQNYTTMGYSGTDIEGITNYDLPGLYDALKNNEADIFSGKQHTKIISEAKPQNPDCQDMDQSGDSGMGKESYSAICKSVPATMVLEFYPHQAVKKDAEIGLGKWYMPSVGEALQMCGELPNYRPSSTSSTIKLTTTTYDKLQTAYEAILAKLDKADSKKTVSERLGTLFVNNTYTWLTSELDGYKQITISGSCNIKPLEKNYNGYTRAVAEVTFKK